MFFQQLGLKCLGGRRADAQEAMAQGPGTNTAAARLDAKQIAQQGGDKVVVEKVRAAGQRDHERDDLRKALVNGECANTMAVNKCELRKMSQKYELLLVGAGL